MVEHPIGCEVAGRYRILSVLGRGGAATTYEAEHLESHQRVALKVLSMTHAREWKGVELFEREARILASLSHPAIPRYVEHFTEDDANGTTLYLAQSLAPGETLAALLAKGWTPDEAAVRDVARQVLVVLIALQRHVPAIVHRDLKPQNLLRDTDGRIYVVDFGSVRDVVREGGGSTTVGTYGYMAPEQLQGVTTPATDLYGLGATLAHLLTRTPPSELPKKRLQLDFRSRAHVSPAFALWLDRMLSPTAEDRFADAMTALRALEGKAPAATGVGRARVVVGASLLAAVSIGAGTFVYFSEHRASQGSIGGPNAAAARGPTLPPRPWTNRYERLVRFERLINAHFAQVFAVAISPDGRTLATGSRDGTVKLWNPDTGSAIRALSGFVGAIGSAEFASDGATLAVADAAGVKLWDTTTWTQRAAISSGNVQATGVAFSPDGHRLVASLWNGRALVIDVATAAIARTLTHDAKGSRVLSVGWSPDGTWLITGGDDKTIKRWDATTFALLTTYSGHTAAIGSLAVSPDSKTFVSGSDDGTVRVWIGESTTPMRTITGHSGEVWAVAVSPAGDRIVSGGADGTLRVWDFMRGRPLFAAPDETTAPRLGTSGIRFSHDGARIFGASSDGSARVYALFVAPSAAAIPEPAAVPPKPWTPATNEEKRYAAIRAELDDWGRDVRKLAHVETLLAELRRQEPNSVLADAGDAAIAIDRGLRSDEAHDPASLRKAHEILDRALERGPDRAEVRLVRARSFWFEKDMSHAREEANAALRLRPDFDDALILLADIANETKHWTEAEGFALKVLATTARSSLIARAYGCLEATYFGRGELDRADATYRKRIELAPSSALTKGNYAGFLANRGDGDGAIRWADAAIAQMDYGMVHRAKAIGLYDKGVDLLWDRNDLAGAEAFLDKAVHETSQPTADALYALAAWNRMAAFARKQPEFLDESKRLLDRALKVDATHWWTLQALRDHDAQVALLKGG